jgi:hypothetical protein
MMHRSPFASSLVVACLVGALSLLGCGGVSGSGQVGGQAVLLDGTAFAWLDETTYEDTGDGLRLVLRPSDETTLHIWFSGAYFDPSRDVGGMRAAERQQLEDDLAAADLLRLEVTRGDRVVAGDSLDYDALDFELPGASPWLSSVDLRRGRAELPPGAVYPEAITTLAPHKKATLAVTQVAPRFSGSVGVRFDEADPDLYPNAPEGGATGQLEVRFDVPLISERVAECNFAPNDAGGVDPCARLDLAEE